MPKRQGNSEPASIPDELVERRVWWTSDELPDGPLVIWRGTMAIGVREVRYVPESSLVEARAHAAKLAEALEAAQGEAYLGALIGDDTPDPLKACLGVIDVCVPALRAYREAE